MSLPDSTPADAPVISKLETLSLRGHGRLVGSRTHLDCDWSPQMTIDSMAVNDNTAPEGKNHVTLPNFSGRSAGAAEEEQQHPTHNPVAQNPIHLLPPELLCPIILATTCDRSTFAWTFSHIDWYCRNVALAAPFLWSTIDINSDTEESEERLRRSQMVTLDVKLSLHNPTPEELRRGTRRFRDLVSLLESHWRRVRSLEALSSSTWMGDSEWALQTILSNDLPALETVELGVSGAPLGPLQLSKINQRRTHQVISAHLRSIISLDFTMFASDRLITLRVAHCPDMSLNAFIMALKGAPALETLIVEDECGFDFIPGQISPGSRVVLRHLRTLVLSEIELCFAKVVVKALDPEETTPESFTFRESQGGTPEIPFPDGPGSTFPFTLKLLRDVRRLDFSCWLMRRDAWHEMLRGLPALEYLRIEKSGLVDGDLSCLGEAQISADGGHGLSMPCPALEHIILETQRSLTTSIVRRIVESRDAASMGRMHNVVLKRWYAGNVIPADVPAIGQLVDKLIIELDAASPSRAHSPDDM